MKKSKQNIAYGLTEVEATAAARYLSARLAKETTDIKVTTNPQVIFALQPEDADMVVVKTHPSDQTEWSKLMPVCRFMKENNIKFQIIK